MQILILSGLLFALSSAAVPVSGDATLEWDDNSSNETGFCIEYQINGGTWSVLDSVESNITSYGPISFPPQDTYAFRVYAFNGDGNSDPTNIIELTFEDPDVDPPTIMAIHHYSTNTALLEWTEISNAVGYHVYRGSTPVFTPDKSGGSNRIAENVTDTDPVNTGVQWSDTNAGVGTADLNYFYIVTAINGSAVESENSNVVGDFDYQLITTPSTDFNEIALPLETPGINTADDLLNLIPNCNSVAKWNATTQSYQQYVPGVPPTNFDITAGHPYYVNVTANTMFSLTGAEVVTFFSLITTPTTDFNEVTLPLNKTNITKASELMADIENCNSVAYWNASTQSYKQYVPGVPPTDFNVLPGHPYYVNVTANTTWPEGGLSKLSHYKGDSQLQNGSRTVLSSPHMVWGELDTDLDISQLNLTAYIITRPDEILTHDSPECALSQGYWMIQCASFASGWTAGEILRVVVSDGDQIRYTAEIELTFAPSEQVTLSATTDVDDKSTIPENFDLQQNYPNPFNPHTTIPYQISTASEVSIVIFNALGQQIRQLVDHFQNPGFYQVLWDGTNDHGIKAGSGVYFIHMETSEYSNTRKMTLLQ